MKREDRAKQFIPFDAMKGLTEALRDREEKHARTERREIGEEKQEINSRILSCVMRGMKVRLSCHHAFHDTVIEGRVERISLPYHFIEIGGERIAFEDIYEVEVTATASPGSSSPGRRSAWQSTQAEPEPVSVSGRR